MEGKENKLDEEKVKRVKGKVIKTKRRKDI